MWNKVQVITSQNVKIDFTVATIGSRAIALLIDYIVMIIVSALLILLAWWIVQIIPPANGATDAVTTIIIVAGIIIATFITVGYFLLCETLMKGRTIGKRIMKLRVIHTNGQPVNFFGIFLRTLMRFIDMLPGVYTVGALTMLISTRSQRLGDMVAGTMVVHEVKIKMPKSLIDQPQQVKIRKYPVTAEEFDLVKTLLNRRGYLSDQHYERLCADLTGYFYERFLIEPDDKENGETLLREIYKENV